MLGEDGRSLKISRLRSVCVAAWEERLGGHVLEDVSIVMVTIWLTFTFGRILDWRIGGAVIFGWFSVKSSSSSNSSVVLARFDCCSW